MYYIYAIIYIEYLDYKRDLLQQVHDPHPFWAHNVTDFKYKFKIPYLHALTWRALWWLQPLALEGVDSKLSPGT